MVQRLVIVSKVFKCLLVHIIICESSISSSTDIRLVSIITQIAKFTGPTWSPPESFGPRWAPCWPHAIRHSFPFFMASGKPTSYPCSYECVTCYIFHVHLRPTPHHIIISLDGGLEIHRTDTRMYSEHWLTSTSNICGPFC